VIALGLLPPYRLNVASDPVWMAAFAKHADEVGFESLLTVEHVVVPVGYESRYPYGDSGRMPLPEDCHVPRWPRRAGRWPSVNGAGTTTPGEVS